MHRYPLDCLNIKLLTTPTSNARCVLYSLLTERSAVGDGFTSYASNAGQKEKEEKTRDEKGWHLQSYIAFSSSLAVCVCVFLDMVASILLCV